MQQKDKRVPPSVSAYAEEHGLNKIEKKITAMRLNIDIIKNLYIYITTW